PAMMLIPLCAVWLFLRRRKISRPWRFTVAWALALAFLLAFSVWTARLYGSPHILAASRRMVRALSIGKGVVFPIFFSGVLVTPLAAWRVVSAKAAVIGALFVWIAVVFFSTKLGGFTGVQAFLIGLWIVTAFLFFGAVWARRQDAVFPQDAMLAAWLVLFVV